MSLVGDLHKKYDKPFIVLCCITTKSKVEKVLGISHITPGSQERSKDLYTKEISIIRQTGNQETPS